jgi:hypothetical protein
MSDGLVSERMFLLGVIAMGDLIAGLFFLKYWKTTKDRFFLYFALSFALEAISRYLLLDISTNSESEPLVYSLRLLSYAVILLGIADKNRVTAMKYLSRRDHPHRITH